MKLPELIEVGLADARKNLPELVDRSLSGEVFVFARRGRRLAVMMSLVEYQRLLAAVSETEQRNSEADNG